MRKLAALLTAAAVCALVLAALWVANNDQIHDTGRLARPTTAMLTRIQLAAASADGIFLAIDGFKGDSKTRGYKGDSTANSISSGVSNNADATTAQDPGVIFRAKTR